MTSSPILPDFSDKPLNESLPDAPEVDAFVSLLHRLPTILNAPEPDWRRMADRGRALASLTAKIETVSAAAVPPDFHKMARTAALTTGAARWKTPSVRRPVSLPLIRFASLAALSFLIASLAMLVVRTSDDGQSNSETAHATSVRPEPANLNAEANYPFADYSAVGTDMFVGLASESISDKELVGRPFTMNASPQNIVQPSLFGASVAPNGTSGLKITSLLAGGAADVAGLKVGDVIVSVNRFALSLGDLASHRLFYSEIDKAGRGGAIELQTIRWTDDGWRVSTVSLTLGGVEP